MLKTTQNFLNRYYLQPIYLISLVSTLGSLYASEIAHLTPCPLCWYQRIFMYPIAFISFVAIMRKDKQAWVYILPLTIIGAAVAAYHVLLQAVGEGGALPGCSAVGNTPSCAVVDAQLFGFITIPMLSAAGFITIALLIAGYLWGKGRD